MNPNSTFRRFLSLSQEAKASIATVLFIPAQIDDEFGRRLAELLDRNVEYQEGRVAEEVAA